MKHKYFSRILLGIIILSCLLNTNPSEISDTITEGNYNQDELSLDNYVETPSENLGSPQSTSINEGNSTGIGEALSLTHNANRTDENEDFSFSNGSSGSYNIPLGEGWEGTRLEANLTDLTDEINWVNGSFAFGNDDGTYLHNEDDDTDPNVNGWTFTAYDTSDVNSMSGNYYDSSSSTGRNALELQMSGYNTEAGNHYRYNTGDYAQWTSTFSVPRGYLRDGTLKFQGYGTYLMDFNSFELRVYVDGVMIYAIATYTFEQLTAGSWYNFNIPMGLWINSTNIITNQLNSGTHSISFRLQYTSTSATYNGFSNGDYQQLFIANPELIFTADVKADQIELEMNGISVISSDYGIGTVYQTSSWTGTSVSATFTVFNTANFSFTVDFITDINLFAQKSIPKTNYEANTASLGTRFTVENNTDTNWEFFAYFSVPTGYQETNFTLIYPTDWTITWVSSPQLPDDNQVTDTIKCQFPSDGIIHLSVPYISQTPDGFWKFKATSTNYLISTTCYKNTTNTPDGTHWAQNQTYFAGDWINITAQIKTDGTFTSIDSTIASLNVYFPNETEWITHTQTVSVGSDGKVQFSLFQIPTSGSDAKVGIYNAFISWNNSIGNFGINETGLWVSSFTVKHYSRLIPEKIFVEKIFELTLNELKVTFQDINTGELIQSANVLFENFTSEWQTSNEIAPGFYSSYIFIPSGLEKGNYTLNVEANHSLFDFASCEITIEIIIKAELNSNDYPKVSIEWKNVASIELNLTEYYSKDPILNANFSNDWSENNWIDEIGGGFYRFYFNVTTHTPGAVYSLVVFNNDYGYERSILNMDIIVLKRSTGLDLFLNGQNSTNSKELEVTIRSMINIDIIYFDTYDYSSINSATLEIEGIESNPVLMTQSLSNYTYSFNSSQLGLGTHFLTVYASKENYQTNTMLITLTIIQIPTNISLSNHISNVFSVVPNGEIIIDIVLTDLVSGQMILGANVTYTFIYGSGALLDQDNDGHYIGIFTIAQEGVYTFYITVYKGNEYKFENYQVIISVINPNKIEGWPTWLIALLTSILAALTLSFVLYQKYWRYPKIIRDLRYVRKRIKKNHHALIPVKSTMALFAEDYLHSTDVPIANSRAATMRYRYIYGKKIDVPGPKDKPNSKIEKIEAIEKYHKNLDALKETPEPTVESTPSKELTENITDHTEEIKIPKKTTKTPDQETKESTEINKKDSEKPKLTKPPNNPEKDKPKVKKLPPKDNTENKS